MITNRRIALFLMAIFAVTIILSVVSAPPPSAPPPPPNPSGELCAITNDGVEICDEIDNDCDGVVDEGDVCVVVEDSDDDGGSSSSSSGGGGGGGGGSSYFPSATTEPEPEPEPEPITHINLSWTYADAVASAVVNESSFAVKRVFGNSPGGAFLNQSSGLRLKDVPTVLPSPRGYDIFKVLEFTDAVQGLLFEDLKVSFAVEDDWLLDNNLDASDMTILYPADGDWRSADTSYSDVTKLYTAELKNAVLSDIVIVGGDGGNETQEPVLQRDPVDDASSLNGSANESAFVDEPDSSGSSRGLFIGAIIFLVLAGFGVGGFLLFKSRPDLNPFHKSVSAQVQENVAPVGFDSSSLGSSFAKPASSSSQGVSSSAVVGASSLSSQSQKQSQNNFSSSTSVSSSSGSSPVQSEQHLPQLHSYIDKMYAKGYDYAAIRQKLVSAGWHSSVVDAHITYHKNSLQH